MSFRCTLSSMGIIASVGVFAPGAYGALGRKVGSKIEVPKRRVFKFLITVRGPRTVAWHADAQGVGHRLAISSVLEAAGRRKPSFSLRKSGMVFTSRFRYPGP